MPGVMQQSPQSYFTFSKDPHHNPWLDLLRTLAIGLVLLRHGSRPEASGLGEGFVANVFFNGWVGVDLFFVLSGYLIATGLIRRSGETDSLFPKRYFVDRILRIVPAYYAVLLLCVIGFFPGLIIDPETLGQSFVAHLLFLQDYTGANINVVFWSLGVEEKFYILAPALMLILLKCRGRLLCTAILLALLLLSPLARGLTFEAIETPLSYPDFFAAMRSPFHMSLEGFIVGIAAALLRANGVVLPKAMARSGLCAALLVLVLWLGSHDFYSDITRLDAWIQPTALSLLFGFMVLCAASLSEQSLGAEPFFRVNARLSYTLYLVHFPLIPLAIHFAHGQHSLVFWAIYLTLSYAIASLIHFGVEKPFLGLKQRLKRRDRVTVSTSAAREVMP